MNRLSNVLSKSSSYTRWIQRQDRQAYRQITLEPMWLQTTVVILLLIAIASWAPGARGFFSMRPLPAALFWTPALAVTALQVVYFRRAEDPLRAGDPAAWLLALFGAWVVDFFAAGLVATTSAPGIWLFAGLLAYTVSFHGYSLRFTHETPFALVGTAVTIALAALFASTPEARLVLLILALPVAFCEWVAGVFAVRQDEARHERERMRAAIQAQMLEAEATRASRLENTLVGVLGRNHDANNSLMGALLEAETLEIELQGTAPLDRAALHESAEGIREALEHIQQLTRAIRTEGTGGMQLTVEPVDAHALCAQAAESVRLLHPQTRVELQLREEAKVVSMAGGAASLRSIVENLLLNACQGDGKKGATRVAVALERLENGRVRLVVDDDGPGFRPEQLAQPVTAFATTKQSGTGLGLFTIERLLGASSGTLERGASPFGGARVIVSLNGAQQKPAQEAPELRVVGGIEERSA